MPLYLSQFLLIASTSAINPVALVYTESLGATVATASLIVVSYNVVALLTQIPLGILSDRIGRVNLLYGGSMVAVLGPIFSYLSPDAQTFLFARLFYGFANSMFIPIAWAITMQLATPGNYGRAIGNSGAAVQLGSSIGPLVGGFVATSLGSRNVFVAALLMALPISFCVTAVARRLREHDGSIRSAESTEGPRLQPISKRNFAGGLGVAVLGTTAYGVFTVFFPAYGVQVEGMSVSTIGIILGASSMGQVFVRAMAGSISDILGRRKVIVIGFAVMTFAFYSLSKFSGLPASFAIGIVVGTAFALLVPAGAALVTDSIPRHRQGLGMGSFQSFLSLGTTVGVAGVGFVLETFGFQQTFLLIAGTQVGSAVLMAGLVKTAKKPHADTV